MSLRFAKAPRPVATLNLSKPMLRREFLETRDSRARLEWILFERSSKVIPLQQLDSAFPVWRLFLASVSRFLSLLTQGFLLLLSLVSPSHAMASTLLLSAAAFLVTSARALEVVTGSPCYDDCGGGSTYSTDLVCSDGDYTSTTYGQKMALCLTCESTSLAVNTSMPNGGTTDEYWFMCTPHFGL